MSLLFVALTLLLSEDDAQSRAFLEVYASREAYFVEEPISLQLRIGYDVSFFEEKAIQLFRRSLDLPAQISAPWLEEPEGAQLRESAEQERAEGAMSVALGDDVTLAHLIEERTIDGRTYRVLEIERVMLPTVEGSLRLEAPTLRFAYATRFEEDFIRGRVATDRREIAILGTALEIPIRALPQSPPPEAFGGAIGQFRVDAQCQTRELKVGESLHLDLIISGRGNFESFSSPRLEELPGFHVLGFLEERSLDSRRVTYELSPISHLVKEIPPIPFTYFDTEETQSYQTANTASLPLTVLENAEHPSEPFSPDLEMESPDKGTQQTPIPKVPRSSLPSDVELYGLKASSESVSLTPPSVLWGLLFLCVVGPWVLAIPLRTWMRRRALDRQDPRRVLARRAAGRFRARLRRHPQDVEAALKEYLASKLGCPEPAVVSPDLPCRLEGLGAPPSVCRRVSRQLEQMVGSRYGGTATADLQAVQELVVLLEQSAQTKPQSMTQLVTQPKTQLETQPKTQLETQETLPKESTP